MNIANVELTAEFEKKLSMIEDGTKAVPEFNTEMNKYINDLVTELKTLNAIKLESKNVSKEQVILGVCPDCGKNIIVANGKFGKYYKCTDCDFKISGKILNKTISESNVKELLNKKITKEIKGFTSKNGKKFNAKLKLQNKEIKFEF